MVFSENNESIITISRLRESLIYFLISRGEVVYVGQTKDGLSRPLSHRGKDYDEIKILYCNTEDLDRLEDAFIQKYKPLYNKKNNYATRMSLLKAKKSIREQTPWRSCTIPMLRKILFNLNIETQKDIFTQKDTITYDDYKRVISYIEGEYRHE